MNEISSVNARNNLFKFKGKAANFNDFSFKRKSGEDCSKKLFTRSIENQGSLQKGLAMRF